MVTILLIKFFINLKTILIWNFSEKCSYSNDFNFSLISNFLKILKNDKIDQFETINCENNYIYKEKNFKNFFCKTIIHQAKKF